MKLRKAEFFIKKKTQKPLKLLKQIVSGKFSAKL